MTETRKEIPDPSQSEIDAKNASFWDELCGSQLAKQLGITDDKPESQKKFDDWYFDYYPYLHDHIPFANLSGKDVLEVGLGYGTVAQKIMESGANYRGLDIAAGPVSMATHRARQLNIRADVRQGSILEPPFEPESLDWIVAIGCLHHTGDLAGAIDRVHGLLRHNGQAMFMVYSAASHRQWQSAPVGTLRRLTQRSPSPSQSPQPGNELRGAYDANEEGSAAPQTEFVTKSELRQMCGDFSDCKIKAENIGTESVFKFMKRATAIKYFGGILGLDLYCHVRK